MKTITQQFIQAAESRRKSLGWTRERMCRDAGTSKGMWSDYANGKRSNLTAETMQRVCDALSMKIEITAIELP